MAKPLSLIDILRSWIRDEIPQLLVDPLPQDFIWLGFIRCKCETFCPAAIARIEADRICLLNQSSKPKSEEHFKVCKNIMKSPIPLPRYCYCGEKLIMIHSMNFPSLKNRLIKHHEILRQKEKNRKGL